jgi:hypothetical protein
MSLITRTQIRFSPSTTFPKENACENHSNARVCANKETGLLSHSLTNARARTRSLTLAHALIIRTMTYSFPPHVQDQDDGQVDMENEYYTAKGPCFVHVTVVMK